MNCDVRIARVVDNIRMQDGHFGPVAPLIRVQINHDRLAHLDLALLLADGHSAAQLAQRGEG